MTNVVKISELVWKCLDCGLYRREHEAGEHRCDASTPEAVTITLPASAALDLWYMVNQGVDDDEESLDLDVDEEPDAAEYKDWGDQVRLQGLRDARVVARALSAAGVMRSVDQEVVA